MLPSLTFFLESKTQVIVFLLPSGWLQFLLLTPLLCPVNANMFPASLHVPVLLLFQVLDDFACYLCVRKSHKPLPASCTMGVPSMQTPIDASASSLQNKVNCCYDSKHLRIKADRNLLLSGSTVFNQQSPRTGPSESSTPFSPSPSMSVSE